MAVPGMGTFLPLDSPQHIVVKGTCGLEGACFWSGRWSGTVTLSGTHDIGGGGSIGRR